MKIYSNYDEVVWERFNTMLLELGAKEIMVSGIWLKIEEGQSWSESLNEQLSKQGYDNKSLQACVGGVANFLARDFNVTISQMTSPDRVREIKKKTTIQ